MCCGRSPRPRSRCGGGHRADQARAHGHEPRYARADGGGQLVRHAPGHLERPHGDGDRARRLRPPLHQPEAGAGGEVRGGHPDDQAVHERREGALERHRSPARLGAPRAAADRDARGRLRPARARPGRALRRRRDHPARRPGHHPVDDGHRPRGSRGGGARPLEAQVHRVRAEPHLGRHRGRARAGALVPGDGVQPRARPDRALRRATARRCPPR